MAHTCPTCGGDVFLGEARCPSCKAPIPGAADEARRAGVDLDGAGGAGGGSRSDLPLNGASLLVQKGMADQEMGRSRDDGYRIDAYGNVAGPTFDDQVDAIADLTRPTRDRQGNIVWDWRYALVGGVIVAIVVGIITFLVVSSVASSSKTGPLRTTTTTVRR